MNQALWAALGATAALLLVLLVVGVLLAAGSRRARAREDALASARTDMEALRSQVEELSAALAASQGAAELSTAPTEYVITTAGEASSRRQDLPQVPERAVLSVTLGEPLVKLAAFGYGVRRALAPESRNRIAFEMRREVKRARKQRRRAARRARVHSATAEETAA